MPDVLRGREGLGPCNQNAVTITFTIIVVTITAIITITTITTITARS